ncbi:hypothetical protein BC829DRAFT_416107 [Chytridium lagenaria]|nr:hypothetical protein BC829DRAFT_416107 [Chytridium lagenaria]
MTYRNEKLASFTSLVEDRRKFLYKTISGVREMLVDATCDLEKLLGTPQPTVQHQLKVKEARAKQLTLRRPSPPPPPPALPQLLRLLALRFVFLPTIPSYVEMVDPLLMLMVNLAPTPPPHLMDPSVMTRITDPRQVVPSASSVRRKALVIIRLVLEFMVDDARHKKVDVDGVTRKLTLLQYRQLAPIPETSSDDAESVASEPIPVGPVEDVIPVDDESMVSSPSPVLKDLVLDLKCR